MLSSTWLFDLRIPVSGVFGLAPKIVCLADADCCERPRILLVDDKVVIVDRGTRWCGRHLGWRHGWR